MDLREHNADDLEETLRVLVAGIMSQHRTAVPVQVVQDTQDGHVSMIQPLVKRKITDPDTGAVSYIDHPAYPDAPIHHLSGGGVSKTFPNKQGDTGLAIFSDRPIDGPFQSDGSQPPIDDRVHSFADATFLSGFRSTPRMLQQVSKDSAQTRSDDGHHTQDLHPQNGHTTRSVDPSTPVASTSFSPFTNATTFFDHIVHPTNGIAGNATAGGTTHSHGVDHTQAWMMAANGAHKVLAHPDLGALLSAAGGQHMVQAHPESGVMVQSQTAVTISSEGPLSLSSPQLNLPSKSVGSGSLGAGAAAQNVGQLGGDLGGTLPAPTVLSIVNLVGMDKLPRAANDSAAAALNPPVAVGSPYLNTAVSSGVALLAIRIA